MLSRRDQVDTNLFYQFSKIGYLFLSLGLILGYPWALEAWGNGWWWDPKITGSLITWALYTALLHSNLYVKRSLYRLTGAIGVICFISLLLTYLLTYFGSGVHAYG
jgi:ABC-type transport system involved in cytochrome c biogenesis permease subunit